MPRRKGPTPRRRNGDGDWARGKEWDAFVKHVREDTLKKMDSSAYVASFMPGPEHLDVKYAVELGMAIMLDKPLFVVAFPSVEVPEHLTRVADRIVRADIDTEEGREHVAKELALFHADFEGEP